MTEKDNYILKFDWRPFAELDSFALLCDQEYNFGDRDQWFLRFRGGLINLRARLYGVSIHYRALHTLGIVSVSNQIATEYNVATLFFNMDSAIECLIWALNAIGYAIDENNFIDIKNPKSLKTIGPHNIWGRDDQKVKGYTTIFQLLTNHLVSNKRLYETIRDQHDVSKHRQTIFRGGKSQMDIPKKVWDDIGIGDNIEQQILLAPWEEIILDPNPKTFPCEKSAVSANEVPKLENITRDFAEFINECGRFALTDAKNNIKLNYDEFKK